ncbi:MAG: hypothetical protein ACRER5_16235 [Pseudomonas sp.]
MSDPSSPKLSFMGAPLRPITMRRGAYAILFALAVFLFLTVLLSAIGIAPPPPAMFPAIVIGALVSEAGLSMSRYPLQALAAIAIMWLAALTLTSIVQTLTA